MSSNVLLEESSRQFAYTLSLTPSTPKASAEEAGFDSTSSSAEVSTSDEEEKDQSPVLVKVKREESLGGIREEVGEDPSGKAEEEGVEQAKSIRNFKYIRNQLKKTHHLLLKREADSLISRKLSKQSLSTVTDIRNGNAANVTKNALSKLFADPFFNGQVIVDKTKSGVCVVGHNRETGQYYSTGTHRKHTKKYKGHFHPKFVKSLKGILDLFMLEGDE